MSVCIRLSVLSPGSQQCPPEPHQGQLLSPAQLWGIAGGEGSRMEQRWCGDTDSILEMRSQGSAVEQHWCGDTESIPEMQSRVSGMEQGYDTGCVPTDVT